MIAQDCIHPRLMTMPIAPDRLYGIICTTCTKRLVIGIGDYIVEGSKEGSKQEFCLTGLIKDTFGDTWGEIVERQCRCSKCKKKSGEA